MTERTPDEEATNELLLTWNIRPWDRVVVAGGYSGVAAELILERYPMAQMDIYEPQSAFSAQLRAKFANNPLVQVWTAGLGVQSERLPMRYTGTDAASFVGAGETSGSYELFAWEPSDVRLFYCNIEGYEHVLFPYLIEAGFIAGVDQVAVQVHADVEQGTPLGVWSAALRGTHDLLWKSPVGDWYGWRRKDA